MFKFAHYCYNVLDLKRSMDFYEKALGLKEVRRIEDEAFTLVFMGDGKSDFCLELTYLFDRSEAYDLGENEFHLAFVSDDFDKSYALHKEMDCICYENKEMGIYFINDPDGYWLEIVPNKE